MPTRVIFIVKRGSSIPVHEQKSTVKVKKQRTTSISSIRIKREVVNAVEEVTVKTEEIDGSKPCDSGSGSALCEPSYNPHLSYQTSTSTRSASKQITTKVRTADHTEMCSFNSRIETGLDSLSTQD
eukprot:scaffold43082_cov44-Attheya_sp.AAC.2